MGLLCSWVATRGHPDTRNVITGWSRGVEEWDHKGTFPESSLNRLEQWSKFWQAVLTLIQGMVRA